MEEEGLIHDPMPSQGEGDRGLGDVRQEREWSHGIGLDAALGGNHLHLMRFSFGEVVEFNHGVRSLGPIALRGSGNGPNVYLVEPRPVVEW